MASGESFRLLARKTFIGMIVLAVVGILFSLVRMWALEAMPVMARKRTDAVASEQAACKRAGLLTPHWDEHVFWCADENGRLYRVVRPACNTLGTNDTFTDECR